MHGNSRTARLNHIGRLFLFLLNGYKKKVTNAIGKHGLKKASFHKITTNILTFLSQSLDKLINWIWKSDSNKEFNEHERNKKQKRQTTTSIENG